MTKTTPGAMRATPGPWEVEDRTRVIGADIRATVNGLLTRIAHVAPWPNYQANARLIAASPALLEALQLAAQLIPHSKSHGLSDGLCERCQVEAAISAATGEGKKP